MLRCSFAQPPMRELVTRRAPQWWTYAKTVWSRAVTQSWRDATGASWRNRIIQIVLLAAPLASGLAWQRMRPNSAIGNSFVTNAELTIISALAGFGALMVLFFLWHLAVAVPYQMWREGQDTTASGGDAIFRERMLRNKWEDVADVLSGRVPQRGDDGFRRHLEHVAIESAKRCPEMPIWKAVEYVRQAVGDDDFHDCYPEARRQIRQAALEDRLEVWGRKEVAPAHLTAPQAASSVWTKIQTDYWQEHELASIAISEHADDQAHTWTEGNILKIGDRYWSLRVRQPEVERRWHPARETAPEAKRAPASWQALIASGRDIVQRYRDEGMPETFGKYVVKHRAYLDIQPHLGAEYMRAKASRAERPDNPTQRDWESGEFLRELARLEKEWGR